MFREYLLRFFMLQSRRDFSLTVLLNVVCRVGKSQGNLKDLLSCLLTIKLALKEASRYNWFYFFITAPNHHLQPDLLLKLYPHRMWQWVKLITEAFIVPFIPQSGTAPPDTGWWYLAGLGLARSRTLSAHIQSQHVVLTTHTRGNFLLRFENCRWVWAQLCGASVSLVSFLC